MAPAANCPGSSWKKNKAFGCFRCMKLLQICIFPCRTHHSPRHSHMRSQPWRAGVFGSFFLLFCGKERTPKQVEPLGNKMIRSLQAAETKGKEHNRLIASGSSAQTPGLLLSWDSAADFPCLPVQRPFLTHKMQPHGSTTGKKSWDKRGFEPG